MTELHQKLETRLAKQGKPASGADSLAALVERMRGEIAKALPRHIQENGPRYARTAVTLIRSNPKLAVCSPVSFLSSLMTASSLGLDLNPALGQAYIVPRQRRIKTESGWDTVLEASFQIGYRGLLDLAMRSGKVASIDAQVVHERDKFEYELGAEPKLVHIPALADRGAPVAYYAVARFTSGGWTACVLSREEVLEHAKKFSQSYDSRGGSFGGPWQTDFDEMARKTALRRLLKYCPLSPEIAAAGIQDGSVHRDLSEVQEEKDVLDLVVVPEVEDEGVPAPSLPSGEVRG